MATPGLLTLNCLYLLHCLSIVQSPDANDVHNSPMGFCQSQNRWSLAAVRILWLNLWKPDSDDDIDGLTLVAHQDRNIDSSLIQLNNQCRLLPLQISL